jgi:hypothetical protein
MVEHRTHDRGEQRKRQHRDQQVQRDAPASFASGYRKEDRAGETQSDERVAGTRRGVQVEQAFHAGLAGGAAIARVQHVALDEPPGPDAAGGDPPRRAHGGGRRPAERTQHRHAHHPEPWVRQV